MSEIERGEQKLSDAQIEKKFRHLTEDPVEKLVLRLSVPTIASMLITSFYNMADTFFAGRINNSATGAIGVAFSLMAIIQACGFFFGHGSGNYISRMLGRQNVEEAEKMAVTGVCSSFLFGVLIAVFGMIFLEPLANLLGSTPTILPYTKDYLRYILIGAPFMTASLTLNNQLRFQGSANFAMIGITVGGILNVALDPLFMFVCDMGVSGAALSTLVGQICSFFILLSVCGRKGNIRMSLLRFTPCTAYYKEIFLGGSPSLFRQGFASIAGVCLNSMTGIYGDAAVAGMSIVNRVMNFLGSAMIGYGQGFQPVCGFNFGAKKYDRIIKAFWFCVKTSGVALVLLSAAGYIAAPQLVAQFRNDPTVIEIGTAALRWQCVTFPLVSFITLSNMMMQNLRLPLRAMFLGMARQGLFFVPAVLLLPRLFGIVGLEAAQAAADLVTFILAVPIQMSVLRELKMRMKNTQSDN